MLAGLARMLLVLTTTGGLLLSNAAAQQVQISVNEGFEAPAAALFVPAPAPSESASAAASAPGLGDEPPAADYPSSTIRNGQQLQLRVHAYRNFQPHIYPGTCADVFYFFQFLTCSSHRTEGPQRWPCFVYQMPPLLQNAMFFTCFHPSLPG